MDLEFSGCGLCFPNNEVNSSELGYLYFVVVVVVFLNFLCQFLLYVSGICTGFFFLFRDVTSDNSDVAKFSTLPDTILNLFQMTLGEFKVSALQLHNVYIECTNTKTPSAEKRLGKVLKKMGQLI